MEYKVYLDRGVEKSLKKIPRHILILFDLWIEIIETEGLAEMQKISGYRDHSLKGNRKGQRSTSLNRSWRVIYELDTSINLINVIILEVNNHDY